MNWLKKISRSKKVRYLYLPGLIVVSLGLHALTNLNFYYGVAYDEFPRLAGLQDRLGLHGATGGEASDSEVAPVIIGHRGSGLPPAGDKDGKPIGNTTKAIRAAMRAKVDWIEIDFRSTRDGKIVLFHDEKIGAKTDSTGCLHELDAAELLTARVSVNPPEEILSLETFSEEFRHDLRNHNWILDIKDKDVDRDAVTAWIEAAGLQPDQVIIFGEYDILENFKGCGYKLGYILAWGSLSNRARFLYCHSAIVTRLNELDASLLVLPMIFTNKDLVTRANDIEVDVWCYGSDNERDWREALALGAKGLIIDNPQEAVEYFGRK